MTLLWIGAAVLVAAAVFLLLRRSGARTEAVEPPVGRRVDRAPVAAAPPRAAPVIPPAAVAATPLPEATMPPSLASFHLVLADELTDERKQAYTKAFGDVPRPPRLLHHLVSPDFVNAASSTQLVDMIIGEPLISSRVLKTVNSPMFGLKTPVSSIGQAVTFLGLNTVRSLCLQYILISSFKADSPERKQMLDATWAGSALASGLTQQLAQRFGFEDRGTLVSAVVLSFLGRLATSASMSREHLASISTGGLLERTISEQQTLGLSASQVGRLLMRGWELPSGIVDDAAAIDSVLVTPASSFDADRGNRLAVCYLCARLGERLASGELKDLMAFDPAAQTGAEYFHLRSYLPRLGVDKLTKIVRSPEVDAGVRQMLSAMRR